MVRTMGGGAVRGAGFRLPVRIHQHFSGLPVYLTQLQAV